MLVVAHRGFHLVAPENSLGAVATALDVRCERIEVDVRVTADSELVVLHDAMLDRTTTGHGTLSKFLARDLHGVRLADGSPIPRLREVLEMCRGRAIVCLDVKDRAIGGQVTRLAESVGTDVEVWSTHREVIARAADRGVYAAWISHGVMPEEGPEALADEARQLGARALSFYPADVTPSVAAACHDAGVWLMSGTPNDRRTWSYLNGLGARAIVTDRPIECREWLCGTLATQPAR